MLVIYILDDVVQVLPIPRGAIATSIFAGAFLGVPVSLVSCYLGLGKGAPKRFVFYKAVLWFAVAIIAMFLLIVLRSGI